MQAQVGTDGMHKAGLYRPTDLMQFPWERDTTDLPTQDDVAAILAEMDAINAAGLTSKPLP